MVKYKRRGRDTKKIRLHTIGEGNIRDWMREIHRERKIEMMAGCPQVGASLTAGKKENHSRHPHYSSLAAERGLEDESRKPIFFALPFFMGCVC